ncbi:MAG TPA: hypothetical protein VFL31_00465, partial [Nitrospiraceae bacterium]|nr:hypothetical protein [Nitrospiraceae bacterium]
MYVKRLIPLLLLVSLACQFRGAGSTITPPPPTSRPTAIAASPQPYEQYTIDFLRERTYGGGRIEMV